MHKILLTLALASGLVTHHPNIAVEEITPPVICVEKPSLDQQLLEALQACSHPRTNKLKAMDKTESLLAQGANPNAIDANGDSALHWAIQPWYIASGTEKTPIIAQQKLYPAFCHESIRDLILAGADADTENSNGETAEEALIRKVKTRPIYTERYQAALHTLQEAIAEKQARAAQVKLMQQDQESQNAHAAE